MKGRFITLEGIEGAGKSTILRLLGEEMRQRGYRVICTHEPGDTDLGRILREILLKQSGIPLCREAELLLYLTDRAQHVREKILPALEEGCLVLCDRFSDSTIAYQGYGRGLDINTLRSLDKFARDGLTPHLTILLDLEAEEGLRRNLGTGKMDRFEGESLDFHRRVRNGFLQIARKEPDRVRVIDASRPLREVFQECLRLILEVLDVDRR